MPCVVLLAAPRGAGKTTACERFLERARAAGMRVGGILAPARYSQDGGKVGVDVVDAFTGERRLLATIETEAKLRTVGPYRFDAIVMEWALARVSLALAAPIDVVIIDEIGPLELTHKEGFAPALEQLSLAQAATIILVVRSELLIALQELLGSLKPVTVMLTLANRDQVPARLFEEIWNPVSRRCTENEARSQQH